jgi:hypothetical protein
MTDIDSINHVGIVARRHEATCERYEAMGFQLTPFSAHEGSWKSGGPVQRLGTGNRCVMFSDSFLEILGSVDEADPAPRITNFLARHQGAHIICFGSPEIEAVATRLSSAGVKNSGVLPLQRDVDTPQGMRTMKVKRLQFAPDETPEGYIQVAQHLTPEYIYQPRFTGHSNQAYRLSDAVLVADDVPAVAAAYGRFLGLAPRPDEFGIRFDIRGNFALRIILLRDAPKVLPGTLLPPIPGIAGIVFRTRDLKAAKRILEDRGFAFTETKDGDIVTIPAEEAGGVAVQFQQ